jgi:hypothetical protein
MSLLSLSERYINILTGHGVIGSLALGSNVQSRARSTDFTLMRRWTSDYLLIRECQQVIASTSLQTTLNLSLG